MCFARSHVANSDRITESLLKIENTVQVQPPHPWRLKSGITEVCKMTQNNEDRVVVVVEVGLGGR